MIPVLLKIVNPLDAKNEELPSKSFHLSQNYPCLLYTSDAADERSSVDLGGRRIIKKKTKQKNKNKKKKKKTRQYRYVTVITYVVRKQPQTV